MSLSDPIANMLTMIRNAARSKKESVDIPSSKMCLTMLEIFKKEGYIDNYRFVEDKKQGIARVYLKYDVNKKPAITGLTRVSRPGLRMYAGKKEIPRVLNGLGIAIVSTSSGVITDSEARQKKLGGEILCNVW